MNYQHHSEHLARDPARHPGQADYPLPVRDRPNLFGDGVGRVVQRDRDKRALGPALHDRLQRRNRVSVERVEDVVTDRTAGRQDQRVIGLLSPEGYAIGHEHEFDSGQYLVEETLPGRSFGLAVEQFVAE